MKKLRLEMNDLRVESFDVRGAAESGCGTVRGQARSAEEPCHQSSWGECVPSYEQPCWWTGDPMQDCHAPSGEVAPCTDYQC